jgi:hypothetical protein
MRGHVTATLGGVEIRGLITGLAWAEMIGEGVAWDAFMRQLMIGDPRAVERVLRVAIRDAGDLSPAQASALLRRLMGECTLRELAAFAARLVRGAIDDLNDALGNSPAATGAGDPAAANPAGIA